MLITKDTIIGEILDLDSSLEPYFLEIGMHCLSCPASRMETLEQACQVHGQDVDTFLNKINGHISQTNA